MAIPNIVNVATIHAETLVTVLTTTLTTTVITITTTITIITEEIYSVNYLIQLLLTQKI